MRKLALLSVAFALVAVSLYGCEEDLPTQPKAAAEQAEAPLFSRQFPVKTDGSCLDGQTVVWSASASAWLCTDLPAAEPYVIYYAVVGSLGYGGHFLTAIQQGVKDFESGGDGTFSIVFESPPIDRCAIFISPQGESNYGTQAFNYMRNNSINGFDVQSWKYSNGRYAIVVGVMVICAR